MLNNISLVSFKQNYKQPNTKNTQLDNNSELTNNKTKLKSKTKVIAEYTIGISTFLSAFLAYYAGFVQSDYEKAEKNRIETVQKDKFSEPRTINGQEYLVFGKTKALNSFIQGIEENKDALMTKLNISEQDYKLFTQLAIILADTETNSGENIPPHYTERNLVNTYLENERTSCGLTNIKLGYKHLNKTFKTFGINGDNDLLESPYKAGIATIIRLNDIKNRQYPMYLESISAPKYADTPSERKLEFLDYCFLLWKGGTCLEKANNPERAKKATGYINSILHIKKGKPPVTDFQKEYKSWLTRLNACEDRL